MLALILHAHLPFVRHPEHEVFLEETWLFEAVAEVYLPLIQIIDSWRKDSLPARVTLTLSPTLCSMLADPLLQQRCARHLQNLAELAEKEVFRTLFTPEYRKLAVFYRERFASLTELYESKQRNLLSAFREFQDGGLIEILTCAATHAVLPLLQHTPSVRAQLQVAVDSYRAFFGRDPRGIWLPECAYEPSLDPLLREAGLQWFITDTHGILHAHPRPRYGTFAPVLTPAGVAAFGRDRASAKQVWSRHEGYPGDPRYREFYRDIGFDLELDYLGPHLAAPGKRGFTGLKYHRVTSHETAHKQLYDRDAALEAAAGHAAHFLQSRTDQLQRATALLNRPPIVVAPYDAELFGHWWFEGPEFLDCVVRTAAAQSGLVELVTPGDYLKRHPEQQVAQPGASSWGEQGYWKMWLSDENHWVYRHLQAAQERMSDLANSFRNPHPLQARALCQAGRELLLAQASDWPFILRTGTSPGYARQRIELHLSNFNALYEQLRTGSVDPDRLSALESKDNLFPELNYSYWRE